MSVVHVKLRYKVPYNPRTGLESAESDRQIGNDRWGRLHPDCWDSIRID